MAATSLKLTDKLKQRAVVVAQHQGQTPHALVQAIVTQAAEQRLGCLADSRAAHEHFLATGI
ncbi:MAG: hypothetical protein ACOY6N_09685 [Pseudomonadota bacterium]